jgi:hypothetical protein
MLPIKPLYLVYGLLATIVLLTGTKTFAKKGNHLASKPEVKLVLPETLSNFDVQSASAVGPAGGMMSIADETLSDLQMANYVLDSSEALLRTSFVPEVDQNRTIVSRNEASEAVGLDRASHFLSEQEAHTSDDSGSGYGSPSERKGPPDDHHKPPKHKPPVSTPAPTTAVLLGSGLAGLLVWGRKNYFMNS